MTIITGKIEPLKRIKETLHSRGIYRFNSIGDMSEFLGQYESEKKVIPENVRSQVDYELKKLEFASKAAIKKRDKNLFNKITYYFKAKKIIKSHAVFAKNYEAIILDRCDTSYRELEFVKKTVEGLSYTIAGAIGETAVVGELEKLSDNYYLINDFSLKFNPPIFNKRENDRIFSIQIDHLLISRSGIFILETKNWSAQSIKNLDLRSPVEQIRRASFALFVFLNSDKNPSLVRNHWGRKKMPIRNVIVMTNKAPKSDFQHVKVIPLVKLNGYVQYFEDIFDETETDGIFNFLKNETE